MGRARYPGERLQLYYTHGADGSIYLAADSEGVPSQSYDTPNVPPVHDRDSLVMNNRTWAHVWLDNLVKVLICAALATTLLYLWSA